MEFPFWCSRWVAYMIGGMPSLPAAESFLRYTLSTGLGYTSKFQMPISLLLVHAPRVLQVAKEAQEPTISSQMSPQLVEYQET
jgi:hypothetical protein